MSVAEMKPDEAGLKRGYAKGRARREDIVRVASAHFAERGFLSATVLDIATACGISRAGLLHHFPDKESILDAVLKERDIEDQRRFAPYVDQGGPLGVLRGMVDLAEHNRLMPGLIELFVRLSAESAMSDHPAHGYFTERYARIRTGTARAIRGAQRAGFVLTDVEAESAALRLTATMDGLQLQWLLDRDVNMAYALGQMIREWLTPDGITEFEAIGSRVHRADPEVR